MEKKIVPFDQETHRELSDAEKYAERERLFGTDDVYPMWVADMEFQAAPAIQEALESRVAHGVYGYAMPDLALRETAANWYLKRHQLICDAQKFRASPSIMTTMSAAIEALSQEGEGMVTFIPIYPPFMEVVSEQNRTLHTVALLDDGNEFIIDFTALEEALSESKILLLCNPHNPVGRVWRVDELKKIADLCERYEVVIISDDAHADLVMPGITYHSVTTVSTYAKDHTVTLFGPGKGFNISGLASTLWFSFSDELLKKVDKVFKARHIVAGQIMGYHALKAAYNESEAWLKEALVYINNNLEYAVKRLNALDYFKVYKPEGTYLIWIDCKALKLSDRKLKAFFVEGAKLGLSQGRFFGRTGQGYMRMNCAVPFEKLKMAIDNIEYALKS